MVGGWGGVGWGGGVCTVIFVSTPSPTDLDWTVRLDWSLTIFFVPLVAGNKANISQLSLGFGSLAKWDFVRETS